MVKIKGFWRFLSVSATPLVCLIALSALTGCSTINYDRVVAFDESHGKFKIVNPTGYLVTLNGPKQVDGINLVPSAFDPETTTAKNVVYGHFRCRGSFKVIAHFSKIIGKTESGGYIAEPMGETTFFILIDWINSLYNGESLDFHHVLSGFTPPPPNRFVRETYIAPYDACGVGNIFLPTITIEPVR